MRKWMQWLAIGAIVIGNVVCGSKSAGDNTSVSVIPDRFPNELTRSVAAGAIHASTGSSVGTSVIGAGEGNDPPQRTGVVESFISLSVADWSILIIYIAFVLGMGFYLKRYTKTDEDFFLAGRKNSAWVAGVAFMSANMGAMEVIGYTGTAVKYGIHCAHFYLIGAVPAMLVLGMFMMPFYYSGRIKSIPGYLKERFDEKTRVFNAFIFSIMMVLVSGISLYLLALIMRAFLGWDWHMSVWVAAGLVALYVSLSGLMSAIFTEVIQFFLIWAGILILPVFGFIDIGGPAEVWARLAEIAQGPITGSGSVAAIAPGGYTSLWASTADPGLNPMQMTWMGIVFGLGMTIAFGYWTTDFLIIQRAFSARDLRSARLTPIIGSYFKILLGIVVVSTGIIALALMQDPESGFQLLARADGSGLPDYDSALPLMMTRYFPQGLIGLGITAIVAMLMAGQAGNMSAFTAVWTYDLYQAVFHKDATQAQLVRMGRVATVCGLLLAVAGAYWARTMPTVIDYLQAISSMILAPGVAIILLGMFFKRITPHGAFWGMLVGCSASFGLFLLQQLEVIQPSDITPVAGAGFMAANFWRALWAWLIAAGLAIVISIFTSKRPDKELEGLVWGLTKIKRDEKVAAYRTPTFWAVVTLIIFIVLNVLLW